MSAWFLDSELSTCYMIDIVMMRKSHRMYCHGCTGNKMGKSLD